MGFIDEEAVVLFIGVCVVSIFCCRAGSLEWRSRECCGGGLCFFVHVVVEVLLVVFYELWGKLYDWQAVVSKQSVHDFCLFFQVSVGGMN